MKFSNWELLGGGLLVSAWVFWGAIMSGNALVHVDEKSVHASLRLAEEAEAAPTTGATGPVDFGNALPLLAKADVETGHKAFKKCETCHTGNQGGANKVGPNLWDIIGRDKAAAAGFSYSSAMTGAEGNWTFEDLDKFLASPKDFVKGNKMTFVGVRKADERAAVIAYLRTLSPAPKPLP